MKVSKLKLALAAASLFTVGSAHALSPTDTANATLVVYVSGGGSADSNLQDAVKTLLGNTTDVDTYTWRGDLKNFWAISGKLDTTTLPASSPLYNTGTKTVAFYKRTATAAYYGVVPVARATSIPHLDVTTAVSSGTHIYNVAGNGAVDSNGLYTAGTGTGLTLHKSDAGVTDVDPNLFASPINVPSYASPLSKADVAKLIVNPTNQALHGIAVTLQLRNALQAVEGLTVGSETEANIPSLSSAAIASIYQGKVNTWDQLVVWNSTTSSYNRLVVPSGYDNSVYVIPRAPGAAAQASVNARILNAPNSPAASGPSPQNLDINPYVWEASLPGDVDNILDALDRGLTTAATNSPTTTTASWFDSSNVAHAFDGTKALAIGSQSTEKNTDTLANTGGKKDKLNYRFIKIDGAAPTLLNAFNGSYPLVVEQNIVYRGAAAGADQLTGDKKALIDYVIKESSKPSVLGGNDANFYHQYGQTGYLAISTNGNQVTGFNNASPISSYTFGAGSNLGRTPTLDAITTVSGSPAAPDLIIK